MVVEAREKALEVLGLHKRFGKTDALCGVDLTIFEGERVALLGPNGAGKTSLVRALCGRVRPDRGSIHIFEKSIAAFTAKDRIGYVPQDLALYTDLSTRENLESFGKFHGLLGKDLRKRVDWALDWIGLVDRQHELVAKFSGGMKRRVNLACGCLHQPGLLILDEPTEGVDPQSRHRIYEMLDELHRGGTTLLLTTHHMEEAEANSDRIVILDRGQKIADGTLRDLIDGLTTGGKRVEFQIMGPIQMALKQLVWNPQRDRWMSAIQDVASELPMLLEAVKSSGGQIADIQFYEPSLQDVFIELTGRDLRE